MGSAQSELFPEHFNTGLLGVSYPTLAAVWGLLFSPYRGLFFISPFLLLALPGLLLMWRNRTLHRDLGLVLWSAVATVLFVSSTRLWDGGFAVGPRYLILILPFLALPLGAVIAAYWSQPRFRVLFALLALASALAVWIETVGGQSFPQYSSNPLFDYSLPNLISGDIARNWGMLVRFSGLSSLIPLAVLMLCFGVLLLFSRTRYDPRIRALKQNSLAN